MDIGGAKATIDLNAIKSNYELAKRLAPSSKTLAVIKANAYGHGMLAVADGLIEDGVDGFCVATVAEGVELRSHIGSGKPIVILQGALDSAASEAAASSELQVVIQNQGAAPLALSFMSDMAGANAPFFWCSDRPVGPRLGELVASELAYVAEMRHWDAPPWNDAQRHATQYSFGREQIRQGWVRDLLPFRVRGRGGSGVQQRAAARAPEYTERICREKLQHGQFRRHNDHSGSPWYL